LSGQKINKPCRSLLDSIEYSTEEKKRGPEACSEVNQGASKVREMVKTRATRTKKIDNIGMKKKNDCDLNSSGSTYPTEPMEPADNTVSICCGCRPKAKQKNRKYRKEPDIDGWRRVFGLRSGQSKGNLKGGKSEWTAFHNQHHCGESFKSAKNYDDDDDSMFFFDAVDHPLDDDEFPIDGYVVGGRGKPRVVFTTSIEHPAPRVTFREPDSMLRSSMRSLTSSQAGSVHEDDTTEYPESGRTKAKILDHRRPSLRLSRIRTRSAEDLDSDLRNFSKSSVPDVIGMAGYPGTLTVEELEECQKFLRGLNELPPAVAEQVYSLRDTEDQPYTICRWLRATKFDADAILARLAENQSIFEEAKAHNFYGPNIEDHIGCPLSVFLSQYPFIGLGRGKNGSPVNYLMAGKINPEGIMALVTVEQLSYYFWYSFMYRMKDEMRTSRDVDPDFCRCEGIQVVDLTGLSSSFMTAEIMEVLKAAAKVGDFFPETLHGMLVLNAPTFFTFSWRVIKNFLDARTASRIQLFSSKEKGQQALENLIDKEKEIASDYGGSNISLREALLTASSDSKIVRQEVELIYCKRKSKAAIQKAWNLGAGQCMEITVYTRSVSHANIFVSFNGSRVKSVKSFCKFDEDGFQLSPLPNKVVAVSANSMELVGPGEVMVEAFDLSNEISKAHSNASRGYHLVVGDMKPIDGLHPISIGGSRKKVFFSDDNNNNNNNSNSASTTTSHRDISGVPIGASVSMTGFTSPITRRRRRRARGKQEQRNQ